MLSCPIEVVSSGRLGAERGSRQQEKRGFCTGPKNQIYLYLPKGKKSSCGIHKRRRKRSDSQSVAFSINLPHETFIPTSAHTYIRSLSGRVAKRNSVSSSR